MADLQNRISQVTSENNDLEFDEAIQRHAPLKQRYVHANQVPFIIKIVNKEILKRSRLRKKCLNTKGDYDRKTYDKSRNLCVSLIRRENRKLL